MALSTQVTDSLKEAEGCLRNALAFAARNEKPFVSKVIADMIQQIDTVVHADKFFDEIEKKFDIH